MTPLSVLVDEDGIASVRAEDGSGSFGILPGHADFLTSLAISVVHWTDAAGRLRYCAVRRGMLSVLGGRSIAIATREAVLGDSLATLDQEVLRRFRSDLETQRVEHVAGASLQLNAVRQLMRHLRPRAGTGAGSFR